MPPKFIKGILQASTKFFKKFLDDVNIEKIINKGPNLNEGDRILPAPNKDA